MKSNKLSADILNILKSCEVANNRITITVSNLDRHVYLEVDKVFRRLRGKWNRSAQCHIFPYDVTDIFQAVLDTHEMPPDNPESYYFTPTSIIEDIFKVEKFWNNTDCHILEPSAGTGHIARKIKELLPNARLHIVEWLDLNVQLLEKQGFDVWAGDFLEYCPEIKFDYIIMNPPFTAPGNRLVYIDHIVHAFALLKVTGKLVAITPTGWQYRNDKKSKTFRHFVYRYLNYGWKMEMGTFKEAGTNVETILIILEKTDWKLKPRAGFPSWNAWAMGLYLTNEPETYTQIKDKEKFLTFLDNLMQAVNNTHFEGILLTAEDTQFLWEFINDE